MALDDFNRAEKLSQTRGDAHLQMMGVALWMIGNRQDAANLWLQIIRDFKNIAYTDAAGGVDNGNLLWFASCYPEAMEHRSAAERFLKKRCRTKQSQAWPGAISRYLLGQLGEKELVNAARVKPTNPAIPIENYLILESRFLCQAYFYLGAKRLDQGNADSYLANMERAVSGGATALLEKEYYLAKAELDHKE